MSWPWDALGLDGPAELGEIRRAYAEKLKTTRPEEDPEGFQRLHSAYQSASRHARKAGRTQADAQAKAAQAREERQTAAAVAAPKRSQDWDFARLFAEGDAERRGRQFQRALELRRANRLRYQAFRQTPLSPAEAGRRWIAVSAALSALELLDSMEAPAPQWRAFITGEVFQAVKDEPDFIFALEAFLRERPKLAREIRAALFFAYGFQRGRIAWQYRPLYRLLGGREFRDIPRIAAVCLFAPVILTLVMLLVPRFSWQNRVCRWLEEDFGRPFQALDHGPLPFFTLRGRFTPAGTSPANTAGTSPAETDATEEPPLIFLASPVSRRRNTAEGERGYQTNYTALLLERELEAFVAAQGWTMTPEGVSRATQRPPAFYLYLPLTGAGEGIRALGERFAALSRSAWYRTLPPEYEVYLCWENWCFYHIDSRTETFDAEKARAYYENEFIPALDKMRS